MECTQQAGEVDKGVEKVEYVGGAIPESRDGESRYERTYRNGF